MCLKCVVEVRETARIAGGGSKAYLPSQVILLVIIIFDSDKIQDNVDGCPNNINLELTSHTHTHILMELLYEILFIENSPVHDHKYNPFSLLNSLMACFPNEVALAAFSK